MGRSRLYLVTDWPVAARSARYRCENLASECFVSERQLERFFVRQFQQTPKQWMQTLRMRLAQGLIQRGYSTKAVADELCYKGACQFCREFKKHFGYSPQYCTAVPGCRVSSMMSGLANPSPLNRRE
jgi:transcriptional regulator GlxA family with amidase domain